LAETYKVPELCFDEQANKWRYNFHTWISKLKSIIAMFPQTASVFTGDKVVFYSNPDCIGNKALFLLLGSRTDALYVLKTRRLQLTTSDDSLLEKLKLKTPTIPTPKLNLLILF